MKLTSGLTAEVISPANQPVMALVTWQVTSKNPQLLLAAAVVPAQAPARGTRAGPAGDGPGGRSPPWRPRQ